jgi:hypothetical protein
MGRTSRLRRGALTLAALVFGASAARGEPAAPTVAQISAELGLGADAVRAIERGKMVDFATKELSERDLAAGFVFLVKAPPAEIANGFRRYGDLPDDPSVVASHALSEGASAADLAPLHLMPHGADEARRYATARPGDTLNLSAEEIAALAKLGASATEASVEPTLRQLLLARYRAYRTRGLDGIAAYARGKEERRPAEELLRVTTAMLPILRRHAPEFAEALRAYPAHRPPGLGESYSWIVHNEDERPTVTLRHRMMLAVGDGMVLSDREFYVSWGYNDMQALGALLPVQGGTIVIYSAHTSTDRVGGAATAMKHSVGRSMMEKQLKQIFDRSRQRVAK